MEKREIADRYQFIEFLGEGRYGQVWKSLDTKDPNQPKALKMIKKNDKDSDYYSHVALEAHILKNCDSKNLIKCYDYFQTKGNYYIVFEVCNDGNLKTYLRKNGILPEKKAIEIIRQCLNGLKALHQINVMHRDLKPENILINDNVYKIADLGIAKIADLTNSIKGTLRYTAYEIIFNIYMKKNENYDSRVDIWSLGVILYEMLFGEHLFSGSTDEEIKKNILYENIEENLKNKCNHNKISSNCFYLLKKMLKRDKEQRITWEKLYAFPFFEIDFILEKNYCGSITSKSELKMWYSYKSSIGDNKKIMSQISSDIISTKIKDFQNYQEENKCNPASESNHEFFSPFLTKIYTNPKVGDYSNKTNSPTNKTNKSEIRYLFIQFFLNHMTKIVEKGINYTNDPGYISGYGFALNQLTNFQKLFYEEMEIKKNKFPQLLDSFNEFLETDTYKKIKLYAKVNLENLIKTSERKKTVLGSIKIDLKIYMLEYIRDYDELISYLVNNKIIGCKREAKLDFLFFLNCLNWESVFVFDENKEEKGGFDIEDYEKQIKKLDIKEIESRIEEGKIKLEKNPHILNFDFNI